MIRLVTVKRLERLKDTIRELNSQLRQDRAVEARLRGEIEATRRERDFYRAEKEAWERRASRLIDGIGITSGTLPAPAMSEPTAAPENVRSIMRSVGISEINRKTSEAAPPSPSAASILGVDEGAARAALDSIS